MAKKKAAIDDNNPLPTPEQRANMVANARVVQKRNAELAEQQRKQREVEIEREVEQAQDAQVAALLKDISRAVQGAIDDDPDAKKTTTERHRTDDATRTNGTTIDPRVIQRVAASGRKLGYKIEFSEGSRRYDASPNINDADHYRPGQRDDWRTCYFDLITITW
jgi:hypothetical protein